MGFNEILRIIKNVVNNVNDASDKVNDAAQTPIGEKIVEIISIIVIAYIVMMIVMVLGVIIHAILSSVSVEAGGCAGLGVGTIFLAIGSSQGIGWYGVLAAVVTALLGISLAAETFILINKYGSQYAKTHLKKSVTMLCSAFVGNMFIVSADLYGILPLQINKWCLYITSVVMLFNAASEMVKAFVPEMESTDDII